MKPTEEAAFETVIESHLLNTGYATVPGGGFDRERAIFPEVVLAFIRETQPREWQRLETLHGAKTGDQVLADLCKWLDINGCLATLRHSFKCYGRKLFVAFFKATHGLNPDLESRYVANRLGITRQLRYAKKSTKSLDGTLSLNGIPVATLELKTPSRVKRSQKPVDNTVMTGTPARKFLNSNDGRWFILPSIPNRFT